MNQISSLNCIGPLEDRNIELYKATFERRGVPYVEVSYPNGTIIMRTDINQKDLKKAISKLTAFSRRTKNETSKEINQKPIQGKRTLC